MKEGKKFDMCKLEVQIPPLNFFKKDMFKGTVIQKVPYSWRKIPMI